jgi:hypothetical protein
MTNTSLLVEGLLDQDRFFQGNPNRADDLPNHDRLAEAIDQGIRWGIGFEISLHGEVPSMHGSVDAVSTDRGGIQLHAATTTGSSTYRHFVREMTGTVRNETHLRRRIFMVFLPIASEQQRVACRD